MTHERLLAYFLKESVDPCAAGSFSRARARGDEERTGGRARAGGRAAGHVGDSVSVRQSKDSKIYILYTLAPDSGS